MDRTAIVTGASSGIGAEVARELARRSWRVAVVGRNPERTEAVAKSINATAFVCDFDQIPFVSFLLRQFFERQVLYPFLSCRHDASGIQSDFIGEAFLPDCLTMMVGGQF